jgi:hypothetical protein
VRSSADRARLAVEPPRGPDPFDALIGAIESRLSR